MDQLGPIISAAVIVFGGLGSWLLTRSRMASESNAIQDRVRNLLREQSDELEKKLAKVEIKFAEETKRRQACEERLDKVESEMKDVHKKVNRGKS